MIAIGDPRNIGSAVAIRSADNQSSHEQRRRFAEVVDVMAATNMSFREKSASPAAVAPPSGMSSTMDFYGSASFKADIVKREEIAQRVDRLPAPVQKLATEQGVTDLPTLEVVAAVYRACKTMGGQAQCFSSDLGRAAGVTTQRAEEILRDAVKRGWVEERSNSYWRTDL